MNQQKTKAFTLVELIVVITILSILGTIAFISLQGYSTDARDSIRISDISSVKTILEIYNLESGKYPNPTSGVNITYSGSVVWNQGTLGETVYANLSKIDKIPLDPITNKEYTYSTTNNKYEYQIGGLMEGDSISMNNAASSPLTRGELRGVSAGNVEATAYVTGNYNGLMTKTNTGITCNILSVPSIITNDTSVTDLQQIILNSGFVYRGYKNLPSTFKGSKFKQDGGFAFSPNQLIAYTDTGSCTALTDTNSYVGRVNLIKGLQNSYSGTILQTDGEIKNIVNLTINTNNPSSEVINYSGNFVNNNLGGNIETGGGSPIVTYNNCNFNSQVVEHNTSVTGYQTGSVTYGNTCNSEQRFCTDGNLSGTYTFSLCTVLGATGTFNLSQTTVTQGTSVTISNNCSQSPTSYTSSNTSVATVAGTTITTLTAGTTNITPVGGACGDNVAKTLTVNSLQWTNFDSNCDVGDLIIGSQTWAGCNSTLGNGLERGQTDADIGTSNYNGTSYTCYNYSGNNNGTCTKGSSSMASNTKANTWFTGSNSNGDTEYPSIWGKLYTWTNALGACPSGRHLPTVDDWTTLENYLNGSVCRTSNNSTQCPNLGWKSTGVNTRKVADALMIPLSGQRSNNGTRSEERGYRAYLWTGTSGSPNPYSRYFHYSNPSIIAATFGSAYAYSVRCIKD